MTVEEALKYGLIICECGHPLNNHYSTTSGCARCECPKYHPRARVGKFVKATVTHTKTSKVISKPKRKKV
jgi:hypothetical protein